MFHLGVYYGRTAGGRVKDGHPGLLSSQHHCAEAQNLKLTRLEKQAHTAVAWEALGIPRKPTAWRRLLPALRII